MRYLAFLSRYEETKEQMALSKTYRLVVVGEEDFLQFIKTWASWLESFPQDDRLVFASEAA